MKVSIKSWPSPISLRKWQLCKAAYTGVPKGDGRDLSVRMSVVEHADRSGIQGKVPARPDREPDPTYCQRAQELTVREQGNRSIALAQTCQHPVGALGNLLYRFAVRTAVNKYIPARVRRANIGGRPALEVTVVPFPKIRLNEDCPAEAGQFAGAARPLEGAGEHMVERDPMKSPAELRCAALAVCGERQIGAASMLARERPGGFAVA